MSDLHKNQDKLPGKSLTGSNAFTIPEDVDDNEFSLGELADPRSKYSPSEKAEAVTLMVLWGDSKTASAKHSRKVPPGTIRWWKAESSWWAGLESTFKREKNAELDAGMTRAMHSLMDYLEKGITEGVPTLDKKGNVVNVKPSFRDATMALAIMQDKRQVLRGEPTAISAKSATEHLKDAYQQFLEQSDAVRKKKGLLIEDAEYTEIPG